MTNVSNTSMNEVQPVRPVENVATAVLLSLTLSANATANSACMADKANFGQDISLHVLTSGVAQTPSTQPYFFKFS